MMLMMIYDADADADDDDDDDDFLTPIATPTSVNTNMKIFILKHYSQSTLVFSPDRPADCQHGCRH